MFWPDNHKSKRISRHVLYGINRKQKRIVFEDPSHLIDLDLGTITKRRVYGFLIHAQSGRPDYLTPYKWS